MKPSAAIAFYRSPIGFVEIQAVPEGILSLVFVDKKGVASRRLPDCLKACLLQLDEYFRGSRNHFDLPLLLQGTALQKSVWRALADIPCGRTVSYTQTAEKSGHPKAVRAVARAIACNRISLLLPCHRVIGKNGRLTGFAWGLDKKAWLLQHESRFSQF